MKSKTAALTISLAVLGVGALVLACLALRPTVVLTPTLPSGVTPVPVTVVPGLTPGSYPPDCYFNWAYKNLPELSEQIQTAIREIQPEAEAHAQAYGEDCIYADGHADFHAMETDFFVTLRVADLDDDTQLGTLIRRTADLLLARFPTSETPGPQPGRFNFRFSSSGEERYMSFATADYQGLPPDLTGADLLRALIH